MLPHISMIVCPSLSVVASERPSRVNTLTDLESRIQKSRDTSLMRFAREVVGLAIYRVQRAVDH